MDPIPPPTRALARYQVVGAYLALDPPRGQRTKARRALASRTWLGPDGEPFTVSDETIRVWVRRYRTGGLAGLENKSRARRGCQAIEPALAQTLIRMRQEVPERSLDRLIRMVEGMGLVEPGVVCRSTLHRLLQQEGLSERPRSQSSTKDLDRFEADASNDVWQSDMLCGPWLIDPSNPKKNRRAWLYAYLDDHSRLCLHGRFAFKGDSPALELVFRRSIQRWGRCRRVYYDNGATYRSRHMQQIVAELGLNGISFTQVGRPEGHGKIEAFNRSVRSQFLSEVPVSGITTLDQLNEAFAAWVDLDYNRVTHGETGEAPLDRWRAGAGRIEYADEEALRRAFLWQEKRKADKAGVFSLFGTKYQVGPDLARRRLDLRYDPEHLEEVEVHVGGRLVERARPLQVHAHRRPVKSKDSEPSTRPEPVSNWLGFLMERRRALQQQELATDPRAESDLSVLGLLEARMDSEVFDLERARDFLARYGPIEPAKAEAVLDRVLAERSDLHIQVVLDALRGAS